MKLKFKADSLRSEMDIGVSELEEDDMASTRRVLAALVDIPSAVQRQLS